MGSCVSMLNKAKKSKGSNTQFPPKPLSYEEVVLEQNEEENRNKGYVAIPMEEKLPETNDEINESQGENSASDDNNGVVDGDQVGKSVDSVAHDDEVEKSIEEEEEEKEVVVEARVNYGITATTTT
ncbi:hypothetical protein FNV43_RR22088 [Rhamnella rubrinervis]|uniref:Uncharacterized protein n=1 Tax=Rhamnella rubrinervis TaxID=2594499 RepID=A0A8K0DUH3_9ROSA|nr:hypothetical protein FNV43_RR22088 [Rhamnella rubrinervis]